MAACSEVDRGPRFVAHGDPTPHRGGTLRVATYQNVRSLDPGIAYDEISMYAHDLLFDTLVGYEPVTPADADRPEVGSRLQPMLAERWTLSADGKTYAFTLREGVRFSDGAALVAGDFVYSLERILRLGASPFGQFLRPIRGAVRFAAGGGEHCPGLRAVDDRHLEIELEAADASFIFVMAMKLATPLRRAQVEAAGTAIRSRPVGPGPFVLAEWSEGERMVFVRNPLYWNPDRPYLDGITMEELVPRDTAFLKFEAGELDLVDRPSSADFVWIAGRADWKPYVMAGAQMNVYGERMNVRRPPFDDVRVRRALNYALDKDHTVKLTNGRAVPSHGLLPPGMFGRDDTLAPYPHDPARARALLADAGYPDGFAIEYVTLKDEQTEKQAQSLQSDLAEVGVRVTIRLMTFATYLSAIGRPDGPPFSFGSWLMDYPDPSNFMDTRFHSRMIALENSNNDAFYANPRLDELLDRARAEVDPAARAAMYREAERILYDDAPWIWNYHQEMIEVRQPYVMGYAPHPVWVRSFRDAWLDVGPDGERDPR